MTRALLVAGGGGVGKTTLSAALAVGAARAGIDTLVVTVDPARRLADALGLEHLETEPTENPDVPGLWAAMLDAEASWQSVAYQHAPPDVADRLVGNPFFEAVAEHFPASQSYAAAEAMADYLDSGEWELVVVDTPPAAGGIDFFNAPSDIRDLIGGRLLRWITGARIPGRRGLFNVAGRPALRIADGILGSNLLERVAEFLLDLRETYDGVADRAGVIEHHFRSAVTVVITTAEPAPLREAVRFFRELPAAARSPQVVVFNRVLPESWIDPPPAPAGVDDVLNDNLARWGAEARRQVDARQEFVARYQVPLATVPWLPDAPTTVAGLDAMLDAAEGLNLADLGIGIP